MNKRSSKKAAQQPSAASDDKAAPEPVLDVLKGEDSPVEYDLDDPSSCVQFIAAHWAHPPDNLDDVAPFFVETMRSKASKCSPFSDLMQKELLVKNVLKKPDGRKAWLSAWASNGAKRFVKPSYLKQK